MALFTRALGRLDPLRAAAVALGLSVVLVEAAYGFDSTSAPVTTEGLVSALAFLVVAGGGVLYAWRLGAGGIVE